MAKDLHNLIQIREWEVDEKRRKLGELLRLLENLEAQARALEEELVREQQTALESPEEAGFLYGDYAENVIDRRERIQESIKQMEVAIEEAREELRLAYVELKKYEVAQESRDRRMALERGRRDQAELDAISLESYRRNRVTG